MPIINEVKMPHRLIDEEIRHITPPEYGIIYEGGIDLALHAAWYESKGNTIKYAALMLYILILNHPFVNGNKRTATLIADIIAKI